MTKPFATGGMVPRDHVLNLDAPCVLITPKQLEALACPTTFADVEVAHRHYILNALRSPRELMGAPPTNVDHALHIAAGPGSIVLAPSLEETQAGDLARYRFPLRPDLWIEFALPADIRAGEVARLRRFLESLPFDAAAP